MTFRKQIRVAGAQIPVGNDVDENAAAIRRAIDFARGERAEILITPEGSLSGYRHDFDQIQVAEALKSICLYARTAEVGLALGTCFEESDGRCYNQVRLYDAKGSFLGFHAKILLCTRVADPGFVGEDCQYATKPLSCFELDGQTIGALVCNDVWANPEWTPQDDPHLLLKLGQMGARVVFVSVNSGQGEGEEWALNRQYHDSNLRLRARSAGVWLVVADAAGELASHTPSGVVNPLGQWMAQTQDRGEQMFAFTIDLG